MKAIVKFVICASCFSMSVSAGKVVFDNQSNKDTIFVVEFKKIPGSKNIPVAAKKNKEESLEEFLNKVPPVTSLWIYARQKKAAPFRDVYCSSGLTAGELSDSNWKIIFTEKGCDVEQE